MNNIAALVAASVSIAAAATTATLCAQIPMDRQAYDPIKIVSHAGPV